MAISKTHSKPKREQGSNELKNCLAAKAENDDEMETQN
jgi:hypothetical protein